MTSESSQPARCTSDYESHDRQWIGPDLVCVDCGLVDLDAARIVQRFAERTAVPVAAMRRQARRVAVSPA
jgi:DNA-binding response OmpR family regulator